MTPHAWTEDQLVEQPALELLGALGWQPVQAMDETFGASDTLGRETKSDVVLVPRLRGALHRLNPDAPTDAIATAIDELTRDRSAMTLVAANREVYRLLKDGVATTIPDPVHGGDRIERLRVIDWDDPLRNDYLAVTQLSVTGPLYTCRPDLVCFVNGLPLVVIEFKTPGVPARAALDENLTHYKAQVPLLFWYNAFIIASNGTSSRVGSITANWDRCFEWKRVAREDEQRRVSLEVMLRGTCDPVRLLDLVENFTLFSEHREGLIKIIAQNHQYLGVNNAVASMLEARERQHGRAGVFWQTQGSGKSFSMVFFAQKVLRKVPGNWSFVVVTDRTELDDQIARTFKAVGAVSATESDECHATSGAHLRDLLAGNYRYVFTLIHKFQTQDVLCDRADVVVLTDEAHRSQYDTLALNMRAALPRALFLAFTGTPLIAGEERTRDVFGDYVSIYDFQQSVEDNATVRLFYENRTPELQLVNPDLNDELYELIENAQLDEEQEARLERELGRQYHILTRDERLDAVAQDIVRHFLGRGFIGKAMVVSLDKATALRMHDKVRRQWVAEISRVREELAALAYLPAHERNDGANVARHMELEARLHVLTTTDMALVVSPGQNEIAEMRQLGLDIEPHRRRMHDSQPPLDEKFKNPADPLRIVFVCAMWLTGFDAPSCSTVYLDKPMRNHTLMQTIARANRIYPGKHSGIIVDYANVFMSLERALAIYGAGVPGRSPVRDKSELVDELRHALGEATSFCVRHGVELQSIESIPGGMDRLQAVADAVDALISPEAVRRDFLGHERLISLLFRAVKPDPVVAEFAPRVACIRTISESIRARVSPGAPDISGIMGDISSLLDRSITGMHIHEAGPPPLDLSRIDFAALAQRFKDAKHRNTELEVLKAAIRARLEEMVHVNRTRVDFVEKFEELIQSYNAGSRSIEDLFEDLLSLSRSLTEEQERHVRENLTEEELVIFDILTRPAPELTSEERAELRKVARDLLARVKELLVLNWRQKVSARSRVQDAIEDVLDNSLPGSYDTDLFERKCAAVFEHVYERYPAA
jgi:type I restriction enzyme R subunit